MTMAATRTSSRPASRRTRSRPPRRASSARIWARRGFFAAVVIGAGVLGGAVLGLTGKVDNVIQELTLPLRHEDIIRQEAAQHGVQPELVAAVIYAESRFRDQTSSAGARGLMQITPATALHIEKQSGGTTFKIDDLSSPDVNIAYGTFRLRELLEGVQADDRDARGQDHQGSSDAPAATRGPRLPAAVRDRDGGGVRCNGVGGRFGGSAAAAGERPRPHPGR